MVKHKPDDGFTLIEMIFVLFLVALLLLLFPMVQGKRLVVLKLQVEALRYHFIEAQSKALHQKQTVSIACEGASCLIDEHIVELANDMKCYGRVHFNEAGNASRATTFTCSIGFEQERLIVQLGSGRMYVE